MTEFWALVRRGFAARPPRRVGGGTALGFYLIVVAMLPLGLGPDLKLLSADCAGRALDRALLAALLSLPRIFEADHEDGSLEVMATAPLPLELAAAAKGLAHWISTGIPLALLAPLLGVLLNLDIGAYPTLVMTMLAARPPSASSASSGRHSPSGPAKAGFSSRWLVLPLYVPTPSSASRP